MADTAKAAGSFDPTANMMAAVAKNPKLKEYLQDAVLMQKVSMLTQLGQTKPEGEALQGQKERALQEIVAKDPRVMEVYMAMQGLKKDLPAAAGVPAAKAWKEEPQKKEEPPPPEDLRTPEQKEADDFKLKGNELYKKKQFKEAIEMYDKAIAKADDLIYYNNKCAVWIEMGEENYDKVLETLQDLVGRRHEINSSNPGGASFEKVAKVFSRMGAVYEKRKQFRQAIEMYNKSLVEDSVRGVRNALREAERAKEKYEIESYIDPVKAEEHREKGNEFFKAESWANAKKEYDEGIKRNPKDAKLYSDRAAALTKLYAHPDALSDLDECLKLDPTFVKAYSRKGAAHVFMKEYNKALQAYENGLKLEPDNQECLAGREQVNARISESSTGEADEEQLAHAMEDPEIGEILHDPHIQLFLRGMKEDPVNAQKAMRASPELQESVAKLMAAGVLKKS